MDIERDTELKRVLEERKHNLDINLQMALIATAKKVDGTPNSPEDYKDASKIMWVLALQFIGNKANKAHKSQNMKDFGNYQLLEFAVIDYILRNYLSDLQ